MSTVIKKHPLTAKDLIPESLGTKGIFSSFFVFDGVEKLVSLCRGGDGQWVSGGCLCREFHLDSKNIMDMKLYEIVVAV